MPFRDSHLVLSGTVGLLGSFDSSPVSAPALLQSSSIDCSGVGLLLFSGSVVPFPIDGRLFWPATLLLLKRITLAMRAVMLVGFT
jgi:hypothetical protein